MMDAAELPGKVERVELVRLLPGDVLVVTTRDDMMLSQAERQRLREAWRGVLPTWVKVVITHGCDVKVLRPEDGGTETEADRVEEVGRQSGEAAAEPGGTDADGEKADVPGAPGGRGAQGVESDGQAVNGAQAVDGD